MQKHPFFFFLMCYRQKWRQRNEGLRGEREKREAKERAERREKFKQAFKVPCALATMYDHLRMHMCSCEGL